MTTIELPPPAFRLKWRDSAYYVDKSDIGNTDCYTAEQVRLAIEQDRARPVPGEDELMRLAYALAKAHTQSVFAMHESDRALRAAIRQALRQPADRVLITPTCNCHLYRHGEMTAGWLCPVHGQQW